jgi:Uncharacterized conserved domain (SAYSvFN)
MCDKTTESCSAKRLVGVNSTLFCCLQLIGTALWFAGAPVAAHFSVGPLYVLGTMLALILTNLGTRKAGELSAYSIFNPGARQLPGVGRSLVKLLEPRSGSVECSDVTRTLFMLLTWHFCPAGQLNADAIDQQIRAGNI